MKKMIGLALLASLVLMSCTPVIAPPDVMGKKGTVNVKVVTAAEYAALPGAELPAASARSIAGSVARSVDLGSEFTWTARYDAVTNAKFLPSNMPKDSTLWTATKKGNITLTSLMVPVRTLTMFSPESNTVISFVPQPNNADLQDLIVGFSFTSQVDVGTYTTMVLGTEYSTDGGVPGYALVGDVTLPDSFFQGLTKDYGALTSSSSIIWGDAGVPSAGFLGNSSKITGASWTNLTVTENSSYTVYITLDPVDLVEEWEVDETNGVIYPMHIFARDFLDHFSVKYVQN